MKSASLNLMLGGWRWDGENMKVLKMTQSIKYKKRFSKLFQLMFLIESFSSYSFNTKL